VRQRVYRTYQGHAVPDKAYRPGPLFDVSVLKQAPVVTDYDTAPEGNEAFPAGATVLNNMQGIKFFRCNYCEAIIPEHEVPTHECEVPDGEG
jgi:hypothetical protein